MSRRKEDIQAILRPLVESLGFEFWGLEYIQGRGATLRIYIDAENGISVDDCALVSHQISGVLDVEDPIPGEYNLEVSSPGMDRPLFTLAQWARYVGEKIQIRLLAPIAGKRRLTAILTAIDGDQLQLDANGEVLTVPFAQVDRASLVTVID